MSARNRVRLSVASLAADGSALSFTAPDTGYVGLAGYEGMAGIPYVLTWGVGKFEIGLGTVISGAFSRIVHENDMGTTGFQDVPAGAILSIGPTAQTSVAFGSSTVLAAPSAGPNGMAIGLGGVAGDSGLAIGENAQSGFMSLAVGKGAAAPASQSVSLGALSAANGGYSVAIGLASTGADGVESVAIGSVSTNFPGTIMLGTWPYNFEQYRWMELTTDAVQKVSAPITGPASVLSVDAGELWYINARVIGTVFTAGLPTKSIVRSLKCIACATGMLGTLTAATEFTYGSSTATATLTISAAGVIQVKITGIAATTVTWSICLDVQRSADWT